MKHRISRRAFLNGCTLLAAAAAVGSLTSCGGKEAKDSGLAQLVVGSDTYPPYIYLNNDGVPTGIDVEIATEAFRRMGGFDEGYFMYVEDADITRKAQEYGKVMYVPEAHVYHAWHRDTKKKWKNFWMQIRSMLRYWRKWGFRMV